MRHYKNSRSVFLCLLALVLCVIALPRLSKAQASNYLITDLNPLSGGSQSKAFSINRAGRVVGQSNSGAAPSTQTPVSWDGTMATNIGIFGGTGSGSAYAVNEVGYAVGAADTATSGTHPFIWSDIFDKKDLGTLGGNFAIALDINGANQVVGQSEIGGPGVLQDRAFVWDRTNGIQAIATLGGPSNAARGINDSGQIVGFSDTSAGELHGFLLNGGLLTDIPTLGGRLGIANEINNAGQVVGYSTLVTGPLNPPYHAFLWTVGGGLTDLNTLGGSRSIAYDVNNSGLVVGTSEVSDSVNRAFVYSALQGMKDLNSLTAGSGWTLVEARGINDKGQIVGFGINPSGFTHAFLLTPDVDEIPGGEPPPCFITPSGPIELPEEAPRVVPGGVRSQGSKVPLTVTIIKPRT